MDSAADFSGKVKHRARELGFSHVGIAAAQSLYVEGERLVEWLGRGFHATMEYMSRRPGRRIDVREILPGALSVISVGQNYFTPHRHDDDPSAGRISRYAWGEDYHELMAPMLGALADFLVSLDPATESCVSVDAGPVMEKAWAVRAGIGWLGKSANIITRDAGSWIFLGEVITTLALEPDTPIPDYCGTCTFCMDACPTKAIVAPFVVDANRCISFHTIESRASGIPDDPGKDFGSWIFGCDVCQDVCPWNRFERPADQAGYFPREGTINPPLAELAAIGRDEFIRRFAGSPVLRTKHEGFLRNVRNAIRNRASHG